MLAQYRGLLVSLPHAGMTRDGAINDGTVDVDGSLFSR